MQSKRQSIEALKKSSIVNQWRVNYLGYLYEQWNYIQGTKSKALVPKSKFVIYSSYGYGCQILAELLKDNPFIYMDGPILGWRTLNPIRLIKTRYKRIKNRTYGFEISSEHCQIIHPSIKGANQFFQQLSAHDFKIIYLKMEDPLRSTCTEILDKENPSWRKKEDKCYAIAYDLLIDQLTLRENKNAFEAASLKGIRHLSIDYEKDLEISKGLENTVLKVSKFLDTVPVKSAQFKKPIKEKNALDFILNKEELLAKLSKTKFKRMLKGY